MWRALLNAHAAATRAIEDELKQAGLPTLGWYDVLWPLYTAPERRLRMNELAQRAVLSRTGLVRLADRIEAAGLLRREPVPEDRRGAYASITEAGIETLSGCGPSTRAASSCTSLSRWAPTRSACARCSSASPVASRPVKSEAALACAAWSRAVPVATVTCLIGGLIHATVVAQQVFLVELR